ncbi:MAG: efflux RND transporter periplasmic adaptor subunit [Candidatus Omnitrophica bacterium]|nr:efflux RND transporter periplasmic adaptor subunit [Candidatus Omnitrophota bacterium]
MIDRILALFHVSGIDWRFCFAGALAGLLCFGIQGCGESKASSNESQLLTQTPAKPEAVVFVVEEQQKSWPIFTQGSCMARHDAVISARISASVERIYVEEGDAVILDRELAALDVREWEAQRSQAQAELLSLKAQLEKLRAGFLDEEVRQAASRMDGARATYRRLLKDHPRQERLHEAGMIRQSDYEDFQTKLSVAESELDSASAAYRLSLRGFRSEEIKQMEAQVAAAQAALDLTEIRVGYGSIRAPLTGVVSRRLADVGEWVSPGSPLFQIQALEDLWVEAYVAEEDIASVTAGVHASMRFAAHPNRTFEGAVDVVGVELDSMTRSLPIKILASNKDFLLKPGMFADVVLHPAQAPSLVIPKNAIFVEGYREIVSVARDGRLKRLPIQTGRRDDEWIEVLSGLRMNDFIILSDMGGLNDGTEIDIGKMVRYSESSE